MSPRDVEGLAQSLIRRVARTERDLRALQNKNDLGYSSIEDSGAINEYSSTGEIGASFGGQFDGSNGAFSFRGPKPLRPSDPRAEGGAGTLTVWVDGTYMNDETVPGPLDFSRFEVHVAPTPVFDVRMSTYLVGSIESPRGGSITVAPAAGTWYVAVVARTIPGNSSPSSAVVSAVVTQSADAQAIADALAQFDLDMAEMESDFTILDNSLTNARERLGSAEGRLTTIGEELEAAQGEYSSLHLRLAGNESTLSTATNDLGAVKTELYETFPAKVTTDIATAKSQTLTAAADAAQTKVDTATTALQANIDAAVATGQSIIVGGNFESGDKDWTTASHQLTRTSATARSGSKVMFLDPSSSNAGPYSGYVPSGKGKTFYMEAYFRRVAGSTTTSQVGFAVQSNTAANGFSTPIVGQVNASTLSATAWTKVSTTYTIPDTVDAVRTRFAPWAAQSANDYEVDDFVVVDVTAATDALAAAKLDAATKKTEAITAAALATDQKITAATPSILTAAAETAQTKADAAKKAAEDAIALLAANAGNMAPYGDLESLIGGDIRDVGAEARSGKAAFKATVHATSQYGANLPDIPIVAGNWYQIGYWIKASADLTGSAGMPNMWVTDDGTQHNSDWGDGYGADDRGPLTPGVWKRVQWLQQAPSVNGQGKPITKIRPRFYLWNTAGVVGTTVWMDDFDIRDVSAAKQAIDDAKVAKERADAAHTLAGTAEGNAQLAISSANGKNAIMRSLNVPSGEGKVIGDVWWQYADATWKRVIGQWAWNGIGAGGGWIKQQLSHETISSVDIGTLTVIGQSTLADVVAQEIAATTGKFIELGVEQLTVTGDAHFDTTVANTMFADMMETNKIRTAHIAVTDLTNFAPSLGEAPEEWEIFRGFSIISSGVSVDGKRFTSTLTGLDSIAYGPWKSVRPGDKLYAETRMYKSVSSIVGYLQYEFFTASKTYITRTFTSTPDATSGKWVLNGVEVPANAAYARMRLVAQFPSGGEGGFFEMRGYKQAGATLIEPGGIKSENIDVTGTLTARIAQLIEVDIGSLRVTGTTQLQDAVANSIVTKYFATRKLNANLVMIGESANYLANGYGEKGDNSGWASPLTRDATDKPSGVSASFYCNPGQGTIGAGPSDMVVEPETEYIFEIWMKADKPGSRLYLELRDQTGAHGTRSNAVSGKPYAGATNSGYPVENHVVPTVWTKYTSVTKTIAGVEKIRLAGMYFNHPNGTERGAKVWLAGISLKPKLDGMLIADTIYGKTLIGPTIKTATSGARWEIDALEGIRGFGANGGVFFDSDENGLKLTGDIEKEGLGVGSRPLKYILGTHTSGVSRLGLTFHDLTDPIDPVFEEPAQVVSYDGTDVTLNSRNFGEGRRGQIGVNHDVVTGNGLAFMSATQGLVQVHATQGTLDMIAQVMYLNGINLTQAPSNVSFLSTWTNFGSGYAPLRTKEVMPGSVLLSGMPKPTSPPGVATSMKIGSVTPAHRPAYNQMMSCILRCSGSPTYRPGMLQVTSSGEIYVYGGLADLDYVGIGETYVLN